ncbi:MAG: hypothetical protein GXY38_11770 [Planctomycetes bacterium]|nr:hypothetical protein [Planctomycetota bacterium]
MIDSRPMKRLVAICVLALAQLCWAADGHRPRIGMFWSPADIASEPLANIARHDVIVMSIQELGLHWRYAPWPALSETIDQNSIMTARSNLLGIKRLNPHAIVCFEVYFFEDLENHYPPDSPWWLRDERGQRVQFFPGAYRMDLNNEDYVMHVARRIRAINDAAPQAGIFLDNVHLEGKAGWIKLLEEVRQTCKPTLKLLVNAGWKSRNMEWIAPYVNGFEFEDAVSHVDDGDTEAFYSRIAELDKLTRRPLMSVNEVYGPRDDTQRMLREYIRTLVYTDAAFLYADSTHGHKHGWHAIWDAQLGDALDAAVVPAAGALADRKFEHGRVLWLPASARQARRVELGERMIDAVSGACVTAVTIESGSGVILLSSPSP